MKKINNNNVGEIDGNINDCKCCLSGSNSLSQSHHKTNDEDRNSNNCDVDNIDMDRADDEDDSDDGVSEESIECLETFETILRQYDRDANIQLHGIVCEAGSRLGDNYMSIVKRVFVHGTQAQNLEFARTVIAKRPILRRSRRQLFRCDEAFANEIAAFTLLVPQLLAYDSNAVPFPRCLFAGSDSKGTLIVLEDLRAMGDEIGNRGGFTMVDRLCGLDYAHSRLVMQKLGALHGISIAMRTQSPANFQRARNNVHEIVYCTEAANFYATSLNSSVRDALTSLRAGNDRGQLSGAIAAVEQLSGCGQMYELMRAAVHDTTDAWSVMCHGDLWVNNLMFRYEQSGGELGYSVTDVRLIDLQTARCASPVIDILHFIYTSTERWLRIAHLDALLACYTDAVMTVVRRHVHDDRQLDVLADQFTVAGLRRELRSKIMYGLGISMWLLPAVTFHHDGIPDLNTMTLSDIANESEENVIVQMQTPEYHTRIREVVTEFYDDGYFSGVMDTDFD